MTATRYGIIGCGMMGQEHIRNIALLPEADVTAIFEPDAGMAAIAQRMCPNAVMVASIDDLLAVDALDCLLIASPNFLHADQLKQIAAKRPLPVLVEKPLFTDPSDASALRELSATYPAPFWVAMEYRYMPPIAALLEKSADVTGGVQMLSIREHRFPFLEKVNDWNRFNRFSGGTFVEKCCHFFDLMRLVLKQEPTRVMASAGQAVNHLNERYEGEVPDILDHGYVIVDFDGGSRAMLELCMFAEGARYQEEISVVGPNGKLEAFVPGPARFWPEAARPAPLPILVESPRDGSGVVEKEVLVPDHLLSAGDHNGATFFQHKGFVELVRGARSAPDVGFDDGYMAVLMGMAAQRSAQTGTAIEFAEFSASQLNHSAT